MDEKEEGGPLLPTPSSRGIASAKARPQVSRQSSSFGSLSSAAAALKRRRQLNSFLFTLVTAALLAAWGLISSYRHLATRRAQHAARSAQLLRGYTEERVAALPEELVPPRRIDTADLLGHPLMTSQRSAMCKLNIFQHDRYAPLQPSYGSGNHGSQYPLPHHRPRHHLKYFIALNLYNSETVVPNLIRALHSLLVSLDPSRFHISIYENGSTDSTPALLYLFAQLLERIGTGYTITSDALREPGWKTGSRIAGLAELRNEALRPLYEAPAGTFDRVLFLNDVHLCPADLLEMMLQHEVQEADMSCGMDWKELRIKEFEEQGYPLLFYDVWVARDMLGLPFYNIKRPGGDWELPSPVMPNSPHRFRQQNNLPFQVFSCFNGVTILDAALFLPPHNLRFRSEEGGDAHSECYLLCSDIWKALAPWGSDGHQRKGRRGARIQTVPRASVGYEIWEYEKARQDGNTTAFEHDGQALELAMREELIDWKTWPPRLIQNYPFGHWGHQIETPPY